LHLPKIWRDAIFVVVVFTWNVTQEYCGQVKSICDFHSDDR